jgi:hypothetical protein
VSSSERKIYVSATTRSPTNTTEPIMPRLASMLFATWRPAVLVIAYAKQPLAAR